MLEKANQLRYKIAAREAVSGFLTVREFFFFWGGGLLPRVWQAEFDDFLRSANECSHLFSRV